MFAAAIVGLTAGRAEAQGTCLEIGEGSGTYPQVCGHVFTDQGDADHTYQPGEELDDVLVVVTDGDHHEVNSSYLDCTGSIDPCGYYSFLELGPGTWYICVVTGSESHDCSTRSDAEQVVVTAGDLNKVVDLEVPQPPKPQAGPGTGTPGYWKNHPTAWPSDTITVGGVTYSRDQAIIMMGKVSGDKAVSMFSALVSAMLNVAVLNEHSCVDTAIAAGDSWMSTYGYPGHTKVAGSSVAWVGIGNGENTHQTLDDYNNGKLCAPHRN
jgi:hypothetical protein